MDSNMKYLFLLASLTILLLGLRKRIKVEKLLFRKVNYRKLFLNILGIVLLFIALLDLKSLSNIEVKEKNKLPIYIVLDISRSMLAKDILPSRLEVSKSLIKDLIQIDREISIILFSSEAHILVPKTFDKEIALNFLDIIDETYISGSTNIAKPLELLGRDGKEKIVVIFTDGEDRYRRAKQYLSKKLKLFIVGVGTTQGSTIPDGEGILKENGKTVISKLEMEYISTLAPVYTLAGKGRDTKNLKKDISKELNLSEEEREVKEYVRYYQIFLLLGILSLFLGYLDKALLLLMLFSCRIDDADKLYLKREYKEALKIYEELKREDRVAACYVQLVKENRENTYLDRAISYYINARTWNDKLILEYLLKIKSELEKGKQEGKQDKRQNQEEQKQRSNEKGEDKKEESGQKESGQQQGEGNKEKDQQGQESEDEKEGKDGEEGKIGKESKDEGEDKGDKQQREKDQDENKSEDGKDKGSEYLNKDDKGNRENKASRESKEDEKSKQDKEEDNKQGKESDRDKSDMNKDDSNSKSKEDISEDKSQEELENNKEQSQQENGKDMLKGNDEKNMESQDREERELKSRQEMKEKKEKEEQKENMDEEREQLIKDKLEKEKQEREDKEENMKKVDSDVQYSDEVKEVLRNIEKYMKSEMANLRRANKVPKSKESGH